MSKYDNLILGFGQGAGTGDGKLFVLKPTDGNGDFTVVRADSKWVDIDGVITEVPANYPSMPTKDGGCPILLVQGTNTNNLAYTQDLTQSEWLKFGTTITVEQIASPIKDVLADRFTEDTSTGFHRIRQNLDWDANDKYVFSFFAKQNGRSILKIHEATIDSAEFATFDLANGTTSFVDGSGFTCYGSFIKAYPNDWYRCSVICSTPSLLTNETFITNIRLNNGSTSNYTGDGTSGIYITGLNVVKSDILTSYIPNLTTGTSTRAADVIDGAEAPIDNAIGLFQTKITALADDLSVREISLTNNASSDRISFRYNTTSNSIGVITVVGGVADVQNTFIVSDITEENDVKVSWEERCAKI